MEEHNRRGRDVMQHHLPNRYANRSQIYIFQAQFISSIIIVKEKSISFYVQL